MQFAMQRTGIIGGGGGDVMNAGSKVADTAGPSTVGEKRKKKKTRYKPPAH